MQNTPKTLQQLLNQEGVCVPQLFKEPNIVSRIKSNMNMFVELCQTNDEFCEILITLGVKIPIHQNTNMKSIAYSINQILTVDLYGISQIFIGQIEPQQEQSMSCVQKESKQTILEIDANRRYKNLRFMLDYFTEQQKNITCISEICKVLKIINVYQPTQLLQFFIMEKQSYFKYLLSSLQNPSILSLFICILSKQQTQYQLHHKQFKNYIINAIFTDLKSKVCCQSQVFQQIMFFVQQCYHKTYYQRTDQSVILKQYIDKHILCKNSVQYFLNGILNQPQNNQIPLNCVYFLQKMIDRMNLELKKDYLIVDDPKSLPTYLLRYNVDNLYENLPKLLNICTNIHRKLYTGKYKYISYLLIDGLLNHHKFDPSLIKDQHNFLKLLYKDLEYQLTVSPQIGLICNKILHIIIKISLKFSQCQIPTDSLKYELQPVLSQYKYVTEIISIQHQIPSNLLQPIYHKYLLRLVPSRITQQTCSNDIHMKCLQTLCRQKITKVCYQNGNQVKQESQKNENILNVEQGHSRTNYYSKHFILF